MFSGRTSVQDGDGLLGERRTGPSLRSGIEIKLVARAVMEVVQRYAAVIGRQIQLFQQTQVMTAVDWRRSESGKGRGHVISANHKLRSQTAVRCHKMTTATPTLTNKHVQHMQHVEVREVFSPV